MTVFLHVTAADLDGAAGAADGALHVLSADERARAAAYASPVERARRVTARVLLRRVLGVVLGLRPEDVHIERADRGKPAVADGSVHFNLSHSGGLVVIAVGPRPLGVDVERAASAAAFPMTAASRLATAAERRALLGLGGPARAAEVLRFWTRKEAVGKARGLGLDDDLCTLDAWRPGCGPVTVQADGQGWTVDDLAVPAGFVASICSAGDLPPVRPLALVDDMVEEVA